MRTVRRLCLLTAILWIGASPAEGASPFAGARPAIASLGLPANGSLVADDGRRYVLYQTPGGPLTGDTSANRWFQVDLATRVQVEVAPPGPGCRIEAGGPGGLIGRCGDPHSRASLLYRSAFPFDQWRPTSLDGPATDAATEFQVLAVGRDWLTLSFTGMHYAGAVGFATPDGQRIVTEPLARTQGFIDPDTPKLTVPVCRPVALERIVAYAKPWVLLRLSEPGSSTAKLLVQRCGSRVRRVLSRRATSTVSVRKGIATWVAGSTGYVRALRNGHTRTVRVPKQPVTLRRVGSYVLAQLEDGTLGIVRLPASF